jgi:ribosome biogenesis protein SSF1/2
MRHTLTSAGTAQTSGEARHRHVPRVKNRRELQKTCTNLMLVRIFPPIQPHATPLHSIKRVLLLNREPVTEDNGSFTISLRHYAITTKITGVPKAIRRLQAAQKLKKNKKSALPNLGKAGDIADYILDPSAAGYTSASDTEADTDAEVEVSAPVRQKVLSRRDKERLKAGDEPSNPLARAVGSKPRVEKRAVKLVELGPRMKLRLTKVEEDVCGGKTMWHEFITKSKAEVQTLEKKWAQRNKEKEERRRIQKENVEKKRKERAAARGETGEEGEEDEEESMDDEMMADFEDYDMDDDVWQDAADAGEDEEMQEDE